MRLRKLDGHLEWRVTAIVLRDGRRVAPTDIHETGGIEEIQGALQWIPGAEVLG